LKYDVIVIGGGPNGLESAAYLSKAGLKVLLLERRYEIGGGLSTEEVTYPGYLTNTHAIYMMMVDYAPIYQDFLLEQQYNVKHIYPTLQFAMPLSDGRCACLYSDVDKTCENFSKFSQKDADSYRELHHMAKKCVDEFIAPATYVPPSPLLDALIKMQSTEVGRTVLEYSEKSPKEIIDEHFENEHLKGLLLYVTSFWGIEYNQPGLGYLVLLYLDRAINYRLTVGGSHMVAQALGKIVGENGGRIINNVRIKKILVGDEGARGVELEDGTVIEASKAVLSTIDPQQTFLKLVGKENLEEEFALKIEGWEWDKYSLFVAHLALEKAPNFTAAQSNPEVDKAFLYLLGYETEDDVIKDLDAVYEGNMLEDAKFNCCFPTVHDPSQAPPGRHTGLLSRFAPYDLKDGGAQRWYDIRFKEEQTQRCLDTLRRYAPNISQDEVFSVYTTTPIDVENKFSDMVKGSIKQGGYYPLQMGYQRPNDECSCNRTPVKNLYLGGASTYPGAMVIWGSGYLAANAIADDFGVEKWWTTPEYVTKAIQAGLL